MARPSKIHRFTIYEDPAEKDVPNSHSSDEANDQAAAPPPRDHDLTTSTVGFHDSHGSHLLRDDTYRVEDAAEMAAMNIDPTDSEGDEADARRASAVTSTTISSLPESTFGTDQDAPTHNSYIHQGIRPSFRRPSSARRMQMTSPLHLERSPKRSSFYTKSRSGTPRSTRSNARGSPLPKRMQEDDGADEEGKEYPLVLLHVTLLPIELRWRAEALRDLLPPKTFENLQLLRSKVSETIAQRGILIPHPREEYELLEERLLEALDLKKERVTKCGHFRSRYSTSSSSSSEGSVQSGDSALGSSIEGSSVEICSVCYHHIKDSEVQNPWSIKVFAANGLMRAAAWTAAWSEMERVDIEILPWINEDLRRQLDARMADEEAEEKSRREDEEARIREVVEEQVRIAYEHRANAEQGQSTNRDPVGGEDYAQQLRHGATLPEDPKEARQAEQYSQPEPSFPASECLPQVYRRKDVPLSLLLRNYVYLLAQDKRNIFIAALSLLTLWLCLRAAFALGPTEVGHVSVKPEDVPLASATLSNSGSQVSPSIVAASVTASEGTLGDNEGHSGSDPLTSQSPAYSEEPMSEGATELMPTTFETETTSHLELVQDTINACQPPRPEQDSYLQEAPLIKALSKAGENTDVCANPGAQSEIFQRRQSTTFSKDDIVEQQRYMM